MLPTLRVDEVTLRPVQPTDAPALHRHWNRRAVRRYLWDDQPVLSWMVDRVLAEHAEDQELRGIGLFAVEQDGRLVGCAGLRSLAGQTVDAPRRLDDPPELVVSLDHSRWRQGLGVAVARAVVDDARTRTSLVSICAVWTPANVASTRGLVHLGFRQTESLTVLGAEMPAARLDLRPGSSGPASLPR